MHSPLRIDYLATFDTGNASIRWPQKNRQKANKDQHLFDAEILSAIKLSLLIKPFISLRHFELFDNLALAKFVSTHRPVLLRLSEAGLVRICSRLASSWEDICVDWALRNPNEPMHWHHLVPEKQKSYDLASRDGKIRDLRSLETHLDLREHEDANGHPLRLREMVEWYDGIFPPQRIIVTGTSEPLRQSYAEIVKVELNAYLKQRRMLEGTLPGVVSRIEETIKKML